MLIKIQLLVSSKYLSLVLFNRSISARYTTYPHNLGMKNFTNRYEKLHVMRTSLQKFSCNFKFRKITVGKFVT